MSEITEHLQTWSNEASVSSTVFSKEGDFVMKGRITRMFPSRSTPGTARLIYGTLKQDTHANPRTQVQAAYLKRTLWGK